MARKARRSVAGLVGAMLLLVLAAGAYLYYLNTPSPMLPAQGRVFRVTSGENVGAISARLEREGLIRSAALMRLLARLKGTESQFKSGYFRIVPGDSTLDVHDLLVSGYQEQARVTIPEGWTMKMIADFLEKKGITTRAELLRVATSKPFLEEMGVRGDSLEGYLFPDTYFFPKGYPAEGVAETMVRNFFAHLERVVPDYKDWDPAKLHERIVVASIVEREYRRAEEAPLIASVFYNRLRRNIGLESCATLEYIITEIQERPHPSYLTLEDKRLDSPYNTYKWAGLPPGPISNPGMVALDAAFHPAKTDYWYFVLKDPRSGEHYFSQDLEEHNWAKYYYLKSVGAGG